MNKTFSEQMRITVDLNRFYLLKFLMNDADDSINPRIFLKDKRNNSVERILRQEFSDD